MNKALQQRGFCIAMMPVIQYIVYMKRKGISYLGLASHMNRRGVPAKNGGKWHPKTVRGVVKNMESLPRDHWVMRRYLDDGGRIKRR